MSEGQSPAEASRERARAVLAEHGLLGEALDFERPTKTAAMAADALGCELGQIVKSLVLVVDGIGPCVALVAGDRRADLDAVATAAGGRRAYMAPADTVIAVTGYAVGAVSPFGLPSEVPVLVDDSLTRFDFLFPAAGSQSSIVRIELERLLLISGGRLASISQT